MPEESLGQFLAHRRESLGISQRTAAMQAGFSNSHLSDIEMDAKKPSPEILRSLAPVLGLSYIDLLKRAGILTAEDLKQLPADLEPELVDLYRRSKDPNSGIALFMREGANVTPEEVRVALVAIEAWRRSKGFGKPQSQEDNS